MRALLALYRLGGLSGMQLMPYIPALLNNLLPVLIRIGVCVYVHACGVFLSGLVCAYMDVVCGSMVVSVCSINYRLVVLRIGVYVHACGV